MKRDTSLALLVSAILAAACGGSGGDDPAPLGDPGTAVTGTPVAPVPDDATSEPFLPSAARLPSLRPDRTTVFGEPIDGFPDPNVIGDDGFIGWYYRLVDDELVADTTVGGTTFEPPLSHRRLWQLFAERVSADLRTPIRAANFRMTPPGLPPIGLAAISSGGFTRTPGERTIALGFSEAFLLEGLNSIDAGTGSASFERIAVHEFAHVLQHEDTVAILSPDPWTHVSWLGLAESRDAPFGRFPERFREGETARVRTESQASSDPASLLHRAFPDDFVGVYAATNPYEDFAETFELFVRLDDERRVDERRVDERRGAEKLQWMRDWPGGVAIRERLRVAAGRP